MSSIDALLAQARSGLERVPPSELAARVSSGALVVDHRELVDISNEGRLPGAIIIARSVLEWRLAPDSPNRLFDIQPQQEVILVCNEGFSSSLAAATLQQLGLPRATDLIGGYRAWYALSDGRQPVNRLHRTPLHSFRA